MTPKSLLLLAAELFFFTAVFSQDRDTIFFDEDWSVCEQPVAEYYRVCTLNKTDEIYYKGKVEDFYINGKPEMTGSYSDIGSKNGEFIFYSKNGSIIKKGQFVDDEMKGDWYYYDSSGKLRAQFICESAADFTPVFLVNTRNDTLLKNGTGKFSFNTQKDLPGIFPVNEAYFISGETTDNLKNGEFDYNVVNNSRGMPDFSETFKHGVFLKAKSYGQVSKQPLHFLHLYNFGLDRIDMFYHSNIVFGFDANSEQKLINLLVNDVSPKLEFSGKIFYDDNKVFFWIISKVLLPELLHKQDLQESSFSSLSDSVYVFGFDSAYKQDLPNFDGDITLTIDTLGYVVNSNFKTTLTNRDISKINYYLSRITGLNTFNNDGKRSISNVNLKLWTIVDTLPGGKLNSMYVVYDPALIHSSSIANIKGVQVEPKFPGGSDAWNKYLETNLNYAVAAQHGAPNGNYKVLVSFLVNETGEVSDITVLNDPGYGTAEEVVRVIKNASRWLPAIQFGRNVKYRQKQNITFQVTSQ